MEASSEVERSVFVSLSWSVVRGWNGTWLRGLTPPARMMDGRWWIPTVRANMVQQRVKARSRAVVMVVTVCRSVDGGVSLVR